MKLYRSIARLFGDGIRGSAVKQTSSAAASWLIEMGPAPAPVFDLLVLAESDLSDVTACLEAVAKEVAQHAVRVTLIQPPHKASTPFGPRVRRHVANGPVITMADVVAALASSDTHPIFLSSDLLPEAGWLSALEEVLRRFAQAGAVTGLVTDPDGARIVSAGGALNEQARPLPLHAGERVEAPEVAYVQPVLCAADVALLVRGDVWREFAPAIDGGFSVRNGLSALSLLLQENGRPVYLQPFCRLRAIERRDAFIAARDTSGEKDAAGETGAWADALQRWAVREITPIFWRNPDLGRFWDGAPHVLFVDESIPTPDRDSGSCDAFWMIKILVGLGYRVSFVAYQGDLPDRYEAQLRRWGVCTRLAHDPDDLRAIVGPAAATADLVILNRVTLAREVISVIPPRAGGPKIIFNTVDLYHLREERFAKLRQSAVLLDEAARTKRDELLMIARADMTIVVSSYELSLLKTLVPTARTCHLPIPRRADRNPDRGFDDRGGVVFIGGFLHHGNVDAVRFLVTEIWPLVRRMAPQLELQIVGSNATDEIYALQDRRNGVKVLGFVEDLAEVFEGVRLSVAPIRFGAGVKGKVISSLMHGVPCVTTKLAIEGTTLTADEHVLQGDTKDEIAAQIVRLHQDKELWNALAAAGFEAARRGHSVDVVAQAVVEMLKSIEVELPRDTCAPEVLASD